jgi:acylphosphatase
MIFKLPIEIVCRLPLDYPLKAQPEILVRSGKHSLNRKFYENLVNHINNIHTNDVIILELLEWIKATVPSYLDSQKTPILSSLQNNQLEVSRAWIYFHHIFSHDKRQRITSLARELHLSGFSHPGKPGMTCVEGLKNDVDEFIRQLKKLPWKKMQIKEIEHAKVENLSEFCKFFSFEELLFESENQPNHVDLGLLFNFLKEKNFAHILNLFFGINVENK